MPDNEKIRIQVPTPSTTSLINHSTLKRFSISKENEGSRRDKKTTNTGSIRG
jgi:hypothetical protein